MACSIHNNIVCELPAVELPKGNVSIIKRNNYILCNKI